MEACRPWLDEELKVVRPEALVVLGATAAKALFGSAFRVTAHRGQLLDSELAEIVTATLHPSSILRGPPEDRAQAFAVFQADLKKVAKHPAFKTR